MTILGSTILLAVLLCALVAGFLFAFSTVVMPGIRRLDDRSFLQSFQAIDRVIQDGQLLFMLVWVGSVVVLVISAVTGFLHLRGLNRLLAVSACITCLAGVQLPTIAINIPLNNRIQALDPGSMSGARLAEERSQFEARWTRWNTIRTMFAALVVMQVILLAYRI